MHNCGVLRHLPMAMPPQAPRGDAGLGPGLVHVGKAAARAAESAESSQSSPSKLLLAGCLPR